MKSYNKEVSKKLANAYVDAGTEIILKSPETTMKALKQASPYMLEKAERTSTSRNLPGLESFWG